MILLDWWHGFSPSGSKKRLRRSKLEQISNEIVAQYEKRHQESKKGIHEKER
jgi:hypothetical protein